MAAFIVVKKFRDKSYLTERRFESDDDGWQFLARSWAKQGFRAVVERVDDGDVRKRDIILELPNPGKGKKGEAKA